MIERAAVEGKVFHEGAGRRARAESLRPSVATHARALVRKELIRPDRRFAGGRAFRFRHLLIRDAAYESIPKEARAELHERFAAGSSSATGDRTSEYDEIVGYHLEQAYRYRAELGTGRRRDAGARARGRRAARLGRPPRVRPRRRASGGEPHLARRRAAAGRRSMHGRPRSRTSASSRA